MNYLENIDKAMAHYKDKWKFIVASNSFTSARLYKLSINCTKTYIILENIQNCL